MKADWKMFTVKGTGSIKSALEQLEVVGLGLIVVTDDSDRVFGIATDGDIRRGLLAGKTLESEVSTCSNTNFVFATENTSRERLIKLLDFGYRAVPILDTKNKLVDLVTRKNIPFSYKSTSCIRSRAPARVSFGGGGSDVTHYFENHSGAVINATISKFSHAALRLRSDKAVIISSYDLDATLEAKNLDDAIVAPGKLGLIQSILKIVRPNYGFELEINSDFSVGSGLGGSSSVAVAVVGCFNELKAQKWTLNEIAEIAFQAERFYLGVSGGWQDQYAAVFGGFNFMEFHSSENSVIPIRLSSDTVAELEECLLLCDTGLAHNSGQIHDSQRDNLLESKISNHVAENVKLSYEIRTHLIKGRLNDFGDCLDKAWRLKRTFSEKISNPALDAFYDEALANGAKGGKLMGAGGGGHFLFHLEPFKKHKLLRYIQSKGLKVYPLKFESDGLKTWTCF